MSEIMHKYGSAAVLKSLALSMLFCLIFASCVLEPMMEEETPDNIFDAETLYAAVQVKFTGSPTRSQDLENYEDGTPLEHMIDMTGTSDNCIIFFTKSGNFLTFTDLLPFADNYGKPSENLEVTLLVKLHNPAIGGPTPAYCLVLLNGYKVKERLAQFNLSNTVEDVISLIDADVPRYSHTVGSIGGYITMSNSAYLKKDNTTGQYRFAQAQEVDPSMFFTFHKKDEDIRPEDIEQPIIAYVERMVAKVDVQFTGGQGDNNLVYTPGAQASKVVVRYYDANDNQYARPSVGWKAAVEAWGMNALETKNYIFKNIAKDESIYDTEFPYSFGTSINGENQPFFKGWNTESYRRSHWSIDPHYRNSESVYASQYRKALDNDRVIYASDPLKDISLRYVSYNSLKKDVQNAVTEKSTPVFIPENTFYDEPSEGYWPHDVGVTSMLVGAQLRLDGYDHTAATYDLYRDNEEIWYATRHDFTTRFVKWFNIQVSSLTNGTLSYTYYNWNNNNAGGNKTRKILQAGSTPRLYYDGRPLTPAMMDGFEKVCVPATVENGDGKVIPWVDGMYLADANGKRIDLSDNELKSVIYELVGAFDHYNRGRMFYSVPLVLNATHQEVSEEDHQYATGDFGVVRNHWYSVKITSINAIGMAVDDLDQPLVPFTRAVYDALSSNVEVLGWHEFKTEVSFGEGNFNLNK